MQALIQSGYGDPREVLRLGEVPVPTPGDDEVLVRVAASSANPWDWHYVRGWPLLMRPVGLGGPLRPKFQIPGGDVAGTVEQVGARVTDLGAGDEVYGFGHGAFAEFVSVPQGRLARKPANLTMEDAAAVPLGAITALQGLRVGGLQPGWSVLIVGASGGVGTFAVQLAKHMGAVVTGVCSTTHLDMVRGLGADHVLDYTARDITTGPAEYDLALQLGGTYSPVALRRRLVPRGTLIQSYGDGGRLVGPLGSILLAFVLNRFGSQTLRSFEAKESTEALDELRDLIEAGHLKPVIDRTYPLARGAEAIHLVERGSPGGKVLVTIQ